MSLEIVARRPRRAVFTVHLPIGSSPSTAIYDLAAPCVPDQWLEARRWTYRFWVDGDKSVDDALNYLRECEIANALTYSVQFGAIPVEAAVEC